MKRSRPLLSRSGCIYTVEKEKKYILKFSSPFIEERLYLKNKMQSVNLGCSSRPLLSRSGCIYPYHRIQSKRRKQFSSPFIEERLYLDKGYITRVKNIVVLVPFYRGAVVFVQGWADNGVRVF